MRLTLSLKEHDQALKDCIDSGDHLKDCDDDGFCNSCGFQDSPDEDNAAERNMKCNRCGSELKQNSLTCSDLTCPFSACGQDDPKGWEGHPEPPDVDQTIEQFISKHGLGFERKRVDSRPDGLMDSEYMTRHFRCRIVVDPGCKPVALSTKEWHKRLKSMGLYFSQGSAHTADPTLADVLDCLASDASGYESARPNEGNQSPTQWFTYWAESYGYDTDSRKAEKTYKAIKRQAEQLKRTLGAAAYEELLYNTERM